MPLCTAILLSSSSGPRFRTYFAQPLVAPVIALFLWNGHRTSNAPYLPPRPAAAGRAMKRNTPPVLTFERVV